MKKIREILFTIVMIASCGCLLNVGTYAMLPQNNGNTNMQSVSGESLSNDLEGEQSPSRHETSSEWLISNVAADNDGTVLFCYNFPDHSRVTTYRTNMVDGTMVVDASTYTDLSEVYVSEGQAVKKGQKIGEKKQPINDRARLEAYMSNRAYEIITDPKVDEPDPYIVQTQGRFFLLEPNGPTFFGGDPYSD